MPEPHVPAGFRTITPHLVVERAGEAMDFYRRAFGAEILLTLTGPDGQTVMHAQIRIGDSMLIVADASPAQGTRTPRDLGGSPVSIHLYVTDAESLFRQAVEAGCEVRMPLADTFWGDRFGQVRDPYGYDWSIATRMEDLSEAEMKRRMDEWFASFAG